MTMCKLVLVAGILGLAGGLLGFATGCVEEEDDGFVVWECEVECDCEDDDGYYEADEDFEACDVDDIDEIQDDIDDFIEDLVDALEDEGYYNISCDCSCKTDGESCEQE